MQVVSTVNSTKSNPICTFEEVSQEIANEALSMWGHKMGPIRRGNQKANCHMLFNANDPVAVVTTSPLIRERVGGVSLDLTRENTIELSRLCAAKSGICRIAIRMWREFVFPTLGFDNAISYQDSALHKGYTYRFDGWKKVGYSSSGPDTRSGRKGRNKFVWLWSQEEFPP